MRFHHLGIATPDTAAAAAQFGTLLNAPVAHVEEFNGLDVRFLELPHGYLELLEPLEDGVIASYLDRHGPGIHHIAFETPDIEASLATALEMGIELIDETPRPGAWGHEVAFLHPRSTGGVLIEFVSTTH